MVAIPETKNNIITSRQSWFSGSLPVLLFKNDDAKKKRPQRVKTDDNAPNMVKIAQAAEMSGLSQYCIRTMCKKNEIQYVKSGNTYYVNYDWLLEYLQGKTTK